MRPDLPLVDSAVLERTCGGDPEKMRELSGIAVDSCADILQGLNGYARTPHMPETVKLLHKLVGSAGGAGLARLSAAARDMEAKVAENSEFKSTDFQAITDIYNETVFALQTLTKTDTVTETPPPPKPSLPAAFEALREKYKLFLAERAALLEQGAADIAHGTADRDALRRAVHNIAGSGGTYGYADLSVLAKETEKLFDTNTADHLISATLLSLSALCRRHAEDTGGHVMKPVNTTTASNEKRPRVLLADDDAVIRSVVTSLLDGQADIIIADNGIDALKLLQEDACDLALLDDNMPGLSGLEIVRSLGNHKTPVIMLTANDNPDHVAQAITSGAIDYVTKPFDPDTLKSKLSRFIRHMAKKILIADDDSFVREMLSYKLGALGWGVIEAVDGPATLDIARQKKPDLILLDRMMPGIDGLAVFQELKKDPATATIPVIFLTARRHEKDIIDGLTVGAADYITKPFAPDEVVARIRRLIGHDS